MCCEVGFGCFASLHALIQSYVRGGPNLITFFQVDEGTEDPNTAINGSSFKWCFACRPFVCLISFFTSHQQSFGYKGTGLPGLNQY